MSTFSRVIQVLAAAGGLCTVAYALYVGVAWSTYGSPRAAASSDAALDRFMPVYDVREEHHIRVNAPAEVTMQAARRISLNDSPLIRAVFKGRELILRAKPDTRQTRVPFVDLAQGIGWRLLDERPGRELVFGAVTQPWKADVIFTPIAPAHFRAFGEADYVKIVWTFRADPAGPNASVFSTETRAVATDATARERFRRYWAAYSPGIVLIRVAALPLVKAQAEKRR